MKTSLTKTVLAALVVPAIALTAACTGGSNDKVAADRAAVDASGGSGSVAPGTEPGAPEPASAQPATKNSLESAFAAGTGSTDRLETGLAPDGAAQDQPKQSQPDTQGPAIISQGQVSLRSKDIDQTRFELQKVLDALDGTIADEQSSSDKGGRTIRQRLVLRVPSGRFGQAMDEISRLKPGTLVGRSRSSKDVTTEVIDNRTRVASQRASLERIQALLGQAKTLREVISIEAQLSRRQADLDSLEAQQKYLADQTTLSTINVYLTVPSKKNPAAQEKDDHNFLSGLKSGWDHLGSSTNAVLTAVGAVLPFAAVLALIGFPAWAAWRRRNVKVAQA